MQVREIVVQRLACSRGNFGEVLPVRHCGDFLGKQLAPFYNLDVMRRVRFAIAERSVLAVHPTGDLTNFAVGREAQYSSDTCEARAVSIECSALL